MHAAGPPTSAARHHVDLHVVLPSLRVLFCFHSIVLSDNLILHATHYYLALCQSAAGLAIASMSAFCDDDEYKRIYPNWVPGSGPSEVTDCQCLEWSKDSASASRNVRVPSATELLARESQSSCVLRVLFLPILPRAASQFRGFDQLVRHYSLPSGALCEGLQSVTHSFGTRKMAGSGYGISWSHFLCRNLATQKFGNELRFVDLGQQPVGQGAAGKNWMWILCDFVVHVEYASKNSSEPALVTLLCFGAPKGLVARFERLLNNAACVDVLDEPYLLFDIIYDELFQLIDTLAWDLADVFRPVEKRMLNKAKSVELWDKTVDFAELHNMQKNCICKFFRFV